MRTAARVPEAARLYGRNLEIRRDARAHSQPHSSDHSRQRTTVYTGRLQTVASYAAGLFVCLLVCWLVGWLVGWLVRSLDCGNQNLLNPTDDTHTWQAHTSTTHNPHRCFVEPEAGACVRACVRACARACVRASSSRFIVAVAAVARWLLFCAARNLLWHQRCGKK